MFEFANKVVSAPNGKVYLFSVGQAGYIIKSKSGQLLAIDLYLSDCVERTEGHMGFKRLLPHILDTRDLKFDAIITTHSHLDHFDMDSVPTLMSGKRTQLYASFGCKSLMDDLCMTEEKAAYVCPGDSFTQGDFVLHFVSCDHGAAAPDAVGVVIEVDGKRVYETGDTCLRLDRTAEYQQWGDIDVMIAPINGAYGNMDEYDCARFADAMKPKLIVPCHYGMFASHGGNLGKFYDIMNEKYPKQKTLFMRQGEKYDIE